MRTPIVFAAATLLAPAGARVEASRIVDRTFSSEAGFVGGLHQATVRAGYSTIPDSSKLTVYAGVARNIFDSLASLHSDGFNVHRGNCAIAKARMALTTKTLRGGVVPPLGAEARCVTPTRVLLRVRASFTRPPCKATSATLPLTAKGLRGGPFSPLATEFDCFTPRRVLLRIRAAFVKPTTLRTAKPFGYPQLRALGATQRAELAVATLAGKPIAYASIAGAKTARLFTSTDCQED